MQVRVLSRLGDLTDDWDRLVDAQPLVSPFLASWWLDHAAGGRPALVVVSDGDTLLGGAAFELDRVGRGPAALERVRCLGQGALGPDHLDVVAAPDRVADVLRGVRGWLVRRGNRVVDLDGLAGRGRLATVFADRVIARTAAPYLAVGPDPDAVLAARPGQVRSTVRRTAKRLTGTGARVARVDAADAAAGLAALAELHEDRWADASGFLDAWDRFERAATAGLGTGRVELHQVLDGDGAVVATELDLLGGDRLAFYQAGRRTDREWRGVGSWLRAEVLADASRRGIVEYDLLRGDEPYKADWADGRRELVRVRFGVGVAGGLVARAAELRRRRTAGAPDAGAGDSGADDSGAGESGAASGAAGG